MRYPILIESGSADTAFSVVVPDLPGRFSAGDTLDEAVEAAKEAAAACIDAALDDGRPIPSPSSLETVHRRAGWAVGVIELDAVLFSDTIERVNITLPKRVLRRLDDLAKAEGQSRGAFISHLTLNAGTHAETEPYFSQRAARAVPGRAKIILAKAGKRTKPRPEDRR